MHKNDPEFLNKIITGNIWRVSLTTQKVNARVRLGGRPSVAQCKETSLRKVAYQNHVSSFFQFLTAHPLKICVPTGQAVNANFYKDVLDRLIKRINFICPDLRSSWDWFLQCDNAPVHNAVSLRQFLAQKNVTVLHHPPYSLDLAPADYFLFPKLKLQLKGKRFEDIQTIQKNVTDILKGIPETDFKHALEGLAEQSQKCMDSNGVYIE